MDEVPEEERAGYKPDDESEKESSLVEDSARKAIIDAKDKLPSDRAKTLQTPLKGGSILARIIEQEERDEDEASPVRSRPDPKAQRSILVSKIREKVL